MSGRKSSLNLATGIFFALLFVTACNGQKEELPIDPEFLSTMTGLDGKYNPQTHVFRIEAPRPGLKTTVGNIPIPSASLTAWATFTGTKKNSILVGQAYLLEEEVNSFVAAAIDADLSINALHNTLLWDHPRIMSVHFSAKGDEAKLASSIGPLFHKIKAGKIAREPAISLKAPSSGKLDLDLIHQYLWKGEFVDGIYRIETGKGTRYSNYELGEAMGIESWAQFSGTTENAFVNGDIGMLESEMPRVLKALVDEHFKIVSVHSHLTEEIPKLVFAHYLATGYLGDLSRSLKKILQQEKSFRGSQ